MAHTPSDVPIAGHPRRAFWLRAGQFALRFQSYFGLIGILILSALVSPVRNGHNIFLNPENLLNIVRFASENGIIAIGMTLVLITGGIDLSVGAVLALCAVGSASFMMRGAWQTVPAILIILSLGGFIGTLNGLITTRLGIQPFIVTLAMLSAARGVASLWSGGYAIPLAFGNAADMAPPSFKAMFAGSIDVLGLDVPAQMFYFIGAGWWRHSSSSGPDSAATCMPSVGTKRPRASPASTQTASRLWGSVLAGSWPAWRRCSTPRWSTRAATSTAAGMS